MLIKNEHNSSYEQQLDGFDLIDREHKLNTQLLELDKIQVGVENMSYVFDYVVTTIDNKQPIVKELVNYNINNSLDLMGLPKYEVLNGTESFSDIMGKIGKFISYIFKSVINIIKKIIEFIVNIIKSIVDFFRGLFKSNRSGGGSKGSARDSANRQIKEVEDAITKQRNNPELLDAKKKKELKDQISSNDEKIKNVLKNLPTYVILSDGEINIDSLNNYMGTLLKSLNTITSPHALSGYMHLYELSHRYSDVENENLGTLLNNQLFNITENKCNNSDYNTCLNNIFNADETTFIKIVKNTTNVLDHGKFDLDKHEEYSKLEKAIDLNSIKNDKNEASIINITTTSVIYIEHLKDSETLVSNIRTNNGLLKDIYEKETSNSNGNSEHLTLEDGIKETKEQKKKRRDKTALEALTIYLKIVKDIYEVGKVTLTKKKLDEKDYKKPLNNVNIEFTKNSTDVSKLTGNIEGFFKKIYDIEDGLLPKQESIEKDLKDFGINIKKTLKKLEETSDMSAKFIKKAESIGSDTEVTATLKLVKEFTDVYTSMQKDVSTETAKIVKILEQQILSTRENGPYEHLKTLEKYLVDSSKYNILLNM